VVARLTPEGLVLAPGRSGAAAGGDGEAVAYQYPLQVPGMVEVPEAGLLIWAGVVREPVPLAGDLARRAVLDYNKTGPRLLVRSWRPGDRFFPLGMGSPKKLQDFFVDEKVPRVQRQRIPLVLSGEDIIWVVGYRIDHRYRVTPATREVLVLEACDLEETAEERGRE
jgi:tRNA(Ile)-lysidine synthase